MIIIADSGSTKTDWVLKGEGIFQEYSSEGLNPKVKSEKEITLTIQEIFADIDIKKVEKVFFYGAGCLGGHYQSIVKRSLQQAFNTAAIEVEHDLLGAARALFQDKVGIACILGTGSNSCVYNGIEITDNITSLGYLAGDEGSGFHIGKSLIQAYIYRELDEGLESKFEEYFNLTREQLVQEIYTQNQPNKYIAGFSKFCSKEIAHDKIQEIVSSCFQQFIERHIQKYKGYKNLPIAFVGTIATAFQPQLKLMALKTNLQYSHFIQKPIKKLANYHSP